VYFIINIRRVSFIFMYNIFIQLNCKFWGELPKNLIRAKSFSTHSKYLDKFFNNAIKLPMAARKQGPARTLTWWNKNIAHNLLENSPPTLVFPSFFAFPRRLFIFRAKKPKEKWEAGRTEDFSIDQETSQSQRINK